MKRAIVVLSVAALNRGGEMTLLSWVNLFTRRWENSYYVVPVFY